jgi:DNA-binding GntR family transcriptional regulator
MTAKITPADKVYNYIKDQIVTRRLYPGNRIIEEDVAEALGVSRTPIRAALSRLANVGLVEQIPNRGSYVSKPSEEDFRSVFEARKLLETEAFRKALHAHTEGTVELLKENLARQEALEARFDLNEYVSLNRTFHLLLTRDAGNPYYEKYLDELYNKLSTYLLFWDTSADNSRSLQSHKRMFEAFCAKDEEAGLAALLEDIGLGEGDIKKSRGL